MANPAIYDLIVIGAGPAGTMAARVAAEHELSVALLDRARFPRDKPCGGGIVWRALSLLPPPARTAVQRECGTADLRFLDAGIHLQVARPFPLVAMAMREELDAQLLEAARAAGARVFEGAAVQALVREADGLHIDTTAGAFRGRYALAADGAGGPTARLAGFAPWPQAMAAIEHEIQVEDAAFERLKGSARFDFDTVAGGYAWVFPKRAHLSVGIASDQPRAHLKALLARYLARLGIAPSAQLRAHGFVIPSAPRQTLARARVLLAGDAAGFADPITAEGISYALRSGALAAEAVAGGLAAGDAERRYLEALSREILPELAWARRLARVLYRRPWLAHLGFRWAGQRFAEAVADVMCGADRYAAYAERHPMQRRLLRVLNRL